MVADVAPDGGTVKCPAFGRLFRLQSIAAADLN